MHILQITNHGMHQWEVVPGLPDTGGQNIFVNMFSDALADLGFDITIVNRGGYPDPISGQLRRGIDRKDEHQRILYIEDGLEEEKVNTKHYAIMFTAALKDLSDFLGPEKRIPVDIPTEIDWEAYFVG